MRFRGEYAFLSNFYPAKVEIRMGKGRWYFPSAENAYQACKSENIEDWIALATMEPAAAKKYGRKIKLRENWDSIKLDVMELIVALKFIQNPELRAKLIATGDIEIIEENTWNDTYWGVCNGIGENHLGKILMNIRFLNSAYPKVEKKLKSRI